MSSNPSSSRSRRSATPAPQAPRGRVGSLTAEEFMRSIHGSSSWRESSHMADIWRESTPPPQYARLRPAQPPRYEEIEDDFSDGFTSSDTDEELYAQNRSQTPAPRPVFHYHPDTITSPVPRMHPLDYISMPTVGRPRPFTPSASPSRSATPGRSGTGQSGHRTTSTSTPRLPSWQPTQSAHAAATVPSPSASPSSPRHAGMRTRSSTRNGRSTPYHTSPSRSRGAPSSSSSSREDTASRRNASTRQRRE